MLGRLGGLTTSNYRHVALSVEERSVDEPDQGEDRVWVFCGDEDKDKTDAFGKLRCALPVVVRYRKTARDRSLQARTMRELAADISDAMGDEFTITDDISQPVTVQVDELTIVRHVEAPESVLLDVLVQFELTYFHEKGNQARG